MEQYAILYNPRDYPGKFVVRKWTIINGEVFPSVDATVTETIERARKYIPKGMSRIKRTPDDDPVLVEVWI